MMTVEDLTDTTERQGGGRGRGRPRRGTGLRPRLRPRRRRRRGRRPAGPRRWPSWRPRSRTQTGRRVEPIVADLSDLDSLVALVDEAVARLGGVDALVTVATAGGGQIPIDEADWDMWRHAFQVNVIGTMEVSRLRGPVDGHPRRRARSCTSAPSAPTRCPPARPPTRPRSRRP